MELLSRPDKPEGLVRSPLDPFYLQKAGLIDPRRPLKNGPQPGKAWEQNYRIFFNRGTWEGNYLSGVLRLEAPKGFGDAGETTVFGCQLLLDGADAKTDEIEGPCAVERLEFEMNYVDGGLVGWKTRQVMRIYHDNEPGGKEIPGTHLDRTCQLQKDRYQTIVRDKTAFVDFVRKGKMFSDWDLLFRCLTLPFSEAANQACTILEELSVPRTDGELYYAGRTEAQDFGTLHTFICQARGFLPVDYWINSERQLVTAISGSFAEAYIPSELVTSPLPAILQSEAARPGLNPS
jgi:hypothetical protein